MKLICLPYAGGSSNVYQPWKKHMPEGIEMLAVEYAGHGSRITESLYTDRVEAVQDIFSILVPQLESGPYALFGHSMGAQIAFDLYYHLKKMEMPLPVHMFFSGKGAPAVRLPKSTPYHLMEKEEFLQHLKKLGGAPDEFFDQPELLDFFLPILRNDFKLVAMEEDPHKEDPIPCDITVLVGKEEDLTEEQCTAWKHHTKGSFQLRYFQGGHFFIHDHVEEIVHTITRALQVYS
ncbi:MAG: alpha/beta fold hydrolase [Bacteroidota bacterium]